MTAPLLTRAEIAPDAAALASRIAAWFAALVNAGKAPVRVGLCGGSTPRAFYALLASPAWRARVAWDRVQLYWSDERLVSHDDPRSNYRMVRETLLSGAPIAPEQAHPIPVAGDAEAQARAYERVLQRAYGAPTLDPARPLLDLSFLGLGTDGHTASLLPGAAALREKARWVAPVPEGHPPRITLTYPALESSRVTAFVVTGAPKADAVRRARAGERAIPAGALRPMGEVIWFLDAAAAGLAPADGARGEAA